MALLESLPVHPRTGMSAIGLLRDGSPIWPVLGGSEDADEGDSDSIEGDGEDTKHDELADDSGDAKQDDDDAKSDKPDEIDKPLGPAGEKALNAEKAKRRETARLLRETRAELKQLKQAAEQQSSGDDDADEDQTPDVDAIREEAKAAARAEVLAERVSDRIEVLAAKTFKNADDALAHLMRTHEPDDFLDDGKVDAEAIKEALEELLEAKPYLAVPAQSEAKRFKGSGDGGAKPTKQPRPGSLHEAVSRELNKT